jgi:hypothetical protein
MKKVLLILIIGLFAAAAGYCALYFWRSAPDRDLLHAQNPEMAWLKREFKLSNAEYDRVCNLHDSYLPHCAEMCSRIAAKNAEIKDLLSKSGSVTPEVERKLAEAAQIRADCQKLMLQHFYEVSQTMPAPEGKRYLEWIQEKTFLSGYSMMHEPAVSQPAHESHSH